MDNVYATPTLMRAARGAYARSIRVQLSAIGIDDLPRNGPFILAGIDQSGGPRPDMPGELGVTKQAVSQVVDILVNRGYLDRSPDPQDRRRINLELTERGKQVVDAVIRATDAVDHELEERLSADQIEAMRAGLLALADIKTASIAKGTGKRRPVPQFRHFSPIFPVRDLAAAMAHYTALGFDTFASADGSDYGFADRDGAHLHLAVDPDLDAARNTTSTYLYVRDADSVHQQWSQPGIGGRTEPVAVTAYDFREGSHVDPDGNRIRFGSPIE